MELQTALKTVVAYLDGQMEENPSRELADVSNFLQNLITE